MCLHALLVSSPHFVARCRASSATAIKTGWMIGAKSLRHFSFPVNKEQFKLARLSPSVESSLHHTQMQAIRLFLKHHYSLLNHSLLHPL